MSFNEVKQHGTLDFPFALYKVDRHHPRYGMALHWHTSLELIRITEGELLITFDNRRYVGRSGDIFISNPETVHGAIPRDCMYECIVLNLAFVKTGNSACDTFIDNVLNRNNFLCEYISDPIAKRWLVELFDALETCEDGYRFRAISCVLAFLGRAEQAGLYTSGMQGITNQDEKNVQKLKKAIEYIRANYDKDPQLDSIAEAAGLSTKYFCAFFKRMTQNTPVEYLNSYRIEKAAHKLLSTDMSVTEVAYSTGFNDLSYFIKLFGAIKGCTPKNYRKK